MNRHDVFKQIQILNTLAAEINAGVFTGRMVRKDIREKPTQSGFYLLAVSPQCPDIEPVGVAIQDKKVSHMHLYYWNSRRQCWQTFAGMHGTCGRTSELSSRMTLLYWMGLMDDGSAEPLAPRKATNNALVYVRASETDDVRIKAITPDEQSTFLKEHKFVEMRRSIPLYQKL